MIQENWEGSSLTVPMDPQTSLHSHYPEADSTARGRLWFRDSEWGRQRLWASECTDTDSLRSSQGGTLGMPSMQYKLTEPVAKPVLPCLQSTPFPQANTYCTPLPLKLLGWVFAFLPRPALAVALRVNSAFYRTGIEMLHEHLVFGTDRPWPRFTDPEAEGDSDSSSFYYSVESKPRDSVASTVEVFCKQYALNRSYLVNVVRSVDLFPHSTTTCLPDSEYDVVTSATVPALPNLDVLRIHMSDARVLATAQRSFHLNEHRMYAAQYPCCPVMHSRPQCPVPFRLRPRKMVVLGGPAVYIKEGLTVLPYDLLAAVDKYVVLLSPDAELLHADAKSAVPVARAQGIISDIANVGNAKTIVIVFYTPRPGVPWHRDLDAGSGKYTLNETWACPFFAELARAVAHLPARRELVIVNADAIDRRTLGMSYWGTEYGMHELEKFFYAELDRELERERHRARERYVGLPHLAPTGRYPFAVSHWARSAAVSFVSMPEYLATYDTEGEFTQAEIDMWLRPDAPCSATVPEKPEGPALVATIPPLAAKLGYRWSNGIEHEMRFRPLPDPKMSYSL